MKNRNAMRQGVVSVPLALYVCLLEIVSFTPEKLHQPGSRTYHKCTFVHRSSTPTESTLSSLLYVWIFIAHIALQGIHGFTGRCAIIWCSRSISTTNLEVLKIRFLCFEYMQYRNDSAFYYYTIHRNPLKETSSQELSRTISSPQPSTLCCAVTQAAQLADTLKSCHQYHLIAFNGFVGTIYELVMVVKLRSSGSQECSRSSTSWTGNSLSARLSCRGQMCNSQWDMH